MLSVKTGEGKHHPLSISRAIAAHRVSCQPEIEPIEDLEASVIPGRMDRTEFVPQHPDESHKD